MKIFDAAATREALPFDGLIEALRRAFAAGCTVPPRHVHEIGGGEGREGYTSLVMPAWIDGRYYAVKVVNIAPGNAARGLPGLHASVLLFDGQTGAPVALLDGDEITSRRTAAASALAASWLARADATHLLVVGAGRVARLLPQAYAAVRPLRCVTVWARDTAKADALAAEWRSAGFDARPASDLAEAVRAADIVSCATLSRQPLIAAEWLRPGTHLDLIGSFTPAMCEAHAACFAGADVYVDIDEALRKSGDLLNAIDQGALNAGDVRGTLEALARAACPMPGVATRRTVFKSVGTALEDLAAAVLAFEGASPPP